MNLPRKSGRAGLLLSACLAVSALSVPALADPLPKVEKEFADGSVLRFYGQINKGFLNYDDGQESETYDFIDNNNSNTRFGLTYKAEFADVWEYLGTIEIQYAPFSTSNINIQNQSPPSGDRVPRCLRPGGAAPRRTGPAKGDAPCVIVSPAS